MDKFLKEDPSFSDLKFFKTEPDSNSSYNPNFDLEEDFLNFKSANPTDFNSSSNNNHLLDDLESLNFQAGGSGNVNTNSFPVNSASFNNSTSLVSPSNQNFANTSVSFNNNTNFGDFSNSQYFSPQTSNLNTYQPQNYNSNNISEALSPASINARTGSISVPEAKSYNGNSNNFLSSPTFNSPYDSSYDTLRSPSMRSPRMMALSPSSSSAAPKQPLSREEKVKRRREFHNAVERRRRDLIKERIKELGLLVPPTLLNMMDNGKVKESKANKSVILDRSVDYISHLSLVLAEQQKAQKDLSDRIKYLESLPGGNPASISPYTSKSPNQQQQQSQLPQQQQTFVKNDMDQFTDQFLQQPMQHFNSNIATPESSNLNINTNTLKSATDEFNPDDLFPEMKNSNFEDQFWNDNEDVKLDF